MDKKLQTQLKKKLEEEKKKLTQDLKAIADRDPYLKGDWNTRFPQFGDHRSEQDENADEVEEYENRLPVEYSLEVQLKDVGDALVKIGKGEYGQCEECKQEIESERLKANPGARLCLKCSHKAEGTAG